MDRATGESEVQAVSDTMGVRNRGFAEILGTLEVAAEEGWRGGFAWAIPTPEVSEEAPNEALELRATRGGGRAGEPEEETPVRFLNCRVDAFYLAFQGRIVPEVRDALMERLEDAHKLRTAVAVEFGALRGALSERSRDGRWIVQNAEGLLCLEEEASAGWAMEFRPSALFLAVKGPRAALDLGWKLAREVLAPVQDVRLRRFDLCADFANFDLKKIHPRMWLTHRRMGVHGIALFKEHLRAGKRTGFQIGTSDLVTRVYDKTEELKLSRNDGAKREEEETTWRMAGWDGEEDVTRVEFQLRGGIMKELEIRDPEKALAKIDGVWSHCTRHAIRLIQPATSTRRERCKTDPRWHGVRAVVFTEAVKEPPRRKRSPGRARARPTVSMAINYGAQAGVLRPNGVKNARKHVESWSDAYAESYVQLTLDFAVLAASRSARVELVAMLGAKGAAAHVMEKKNASCARFASFEELGEVAIAA